MIYLMIILLVALAFTTGLVVDSRYYIKRYKELTQSVTDILDDYEVIVELLERDFAEIDDAK